MEAKVIKVTQETHDVKCVRLAVDMHFNAGQFAMLTLKTTEGEGTKPFSIASSPTQKGFIEVAKKITDTAFSTAFAELKEDDVVEVKGPYGRMSLEGSKQGVALLAGGIGITPLRSFLHYAADAQLDKKIVLFYSNKTPDDIAFRKDIDDCVKRNPNIKIVYTITQPDEDELWNGAIGRISQGMIENNLVNADNYTFYVCGPPAMVESVVATLKKMNIEENNIHVERFSGY